MNGDKESHDPYLALIDGWLVQALNGNNNNAGGSPNPVDGSSFGQDYQAIFKTALNKMPVLFRSAVVDAAL